MSILALRSNHPKDNKVFGLAMIID